MKMHRFLFSFCVFLLALLIHFGAAHCEQPAQYTALTSISFHLRTKPDGYRITQVPKGSRIRIVEWSDDWCRASYRGKTGYCKTSWLYSLCSLDPYLYPLPDNPCLATGYIAAQRGIQVRAGDFDGAFLATGSIVCAAKKADGLCSLSVWRDQQLLSDDDAEYHAFVPWELARPGDIIGGFTTYFSDLQGKQYPRERAHNIQLGCLRIDHTILASGAAFSFNALCGPYRKSNGYLLAPNISRDRKGYGGGVCQVSTTLYNALLTLPLRIDEWSIHRYTGVVYVPQFFDAAVGSHSDLVFTNSLPYPIEIRAAAGNGIINILITRAEDD